MTVEVLKAEEWSELAEIASDTVPVVPSSACTAIVVRDDGGKIAAKAYLIFPITVMGIWVREDKRSSTALGRLWQKVESVCRGAGITRILASIKPGSQFEDYAARVGFKRPGWDQWVKEL